MCIPRGCVLYAVIDRTQQVAPFKGPRDEEERSTRSLKFLRNVFPRFVRDLTECSVRDPLKPVIRGTHTSSLPLEKVHKDC